MGNDALNTIKNRWPHIHELLLTCPQIQDELTSTATLSPATIFNGIQLYSGFDRTREARMQASLIPEDAEEATIYGFVTEDLPLLLLNRNALKRINIILLNLSLTVALLNNISDVSWLKNNKVFLLYGGEESLPRFPFTVIPPCLQLADKASERIRDFIHLELSTLHINKKHAKDSVTYLRSRLKENITFIKQDKDVASLFGTQKNATILVAGAGPTISQTSELLAHLHKNHVLIAVDAVLTPLVNKNILPDYTVTIDPNTSIAELFFIKNLIKLNEKKLIYFPTSYIDTINCWKGTRYTSYTNNKLYDDLKNKYPKGELFSAGSVIHPAIDLAVKMGCKKVILFGTDFSFPNDMTHAEECAINKKIKKRNSETKVINGHDCYVYSKYNLIGYLRDLEVYIKNHHNVKFINTSKEGALITGTTYYQDGT